MDLNDLSTIAAEQDEGRWFELKHPVTGDPTGIRLLVAGPDSTVQQNAMLRFQNALAQLKAGKGRAALVDQHYSEFLAEIVLDLDATEDGEPVPHSREVAVRVIRAGEWVRKQIEGFAGNRKIYVKPEGGV